MARRSNAGGSRRSRSRGSKRSIDFSQEVLDFEGDMEYAVEVKECKWEEGDKGDYLALIFKGADEEYAETTVYHNASTAPRALSRTRSLLEALGYEIDKDGSTDIDAEELVGMKCMAHTFFEKDQNGTPRIRFDDFWPLEESKGSKSKKDDKASSKSKKGADKEAPADVDLDSLSDADVKKLGKEFEIKSKDVDTIREELAEADPEELMEACNDLDIEIGGKESKGSKRGRKAADKDEGDDDNAKGKRGRSSRGSDKSSGKRGKKAELSQDEVNEMSEEELEDLIGQHDLDVELDDHRTLRKKKAAVIDALQEAGLIEE